jgi:multicomponent Na+:H+ antiporter subunit D
MIEQLPPGSILLIGAFLVPFLRGRALQAYTLVLPLLSAWHLFSLPTGHEVSLEVFGYTMQLVRADALTTAFGAVFHLASFLCFLYSLHVKDRIQPFAGLLYAGSAIGAVYAGDLITLFIFWEGTALSSVFLIWARRTERSYSAGLRYLVVQVGSGVLLLAGAILHYVGTGSLAFDHLGLDTPGGPLIFIAFGIKAAFPLLHNWVQDAYPEATVTGTIFLASFTTKLAIYALARGFSGTEILVPIGAAMTAFPIFFAVIENDLRRVLAYSLNNQIGFMVVAVGIGTTQAINGAVTYAVAQILYEGLLFMTMSAVLFRTGTSLGSELGGLYRSMPWTTGFCMVGAASISAFPFMNGFIAKIFVLTETAEAHHTIPFLIMLFASAGVFHHAGIKIPYFAFFAHDSGRRVKEAPLHMLLAMGTAAALCIGIGIYPDPLFALLPHPVEIDVFTQSNIVGQLQLLFFSALAFAVLMLTGQYPPELKSTNLDTDWLYRRVAPRLIGVVALGIRHTFADVSAGLRRALASSGALLRRMHAPQGALGEPWSAGTSALWAAVLLCAYLLIGYL